MRMFAVTTFAIITSLVVTFCGGPAFAQSRAPGYGVCLHVYGPVGYDDCGYTSMAQCQQSASGRPATCVPNPAAAYAGTDQARRRARHAY
jgi:hypothetical protein